MLQGYPHSFWFFTQEFRLDHLFGHPKRVFLGLVRFPRPKERKFPTEKKSGWASKGQAALQPYLPTGWPTCWLVLLCSMPIEKSIFFPKKSKDWLKFKFKYLFPHLKPYACLFVTPQLDLWFLDSLCLKLNYYNFPIYISSNMFFHFVQIKTFIYATTQLDIFPIFL